MRFSALFLIVLACAPAQQLEFLNRTVDGKAMRDPQGNWIFAERATAGIRLRKLSPDLTQTAFDIVTGGSGAMGISALQVDADGNAFVIGVTTSKDLPTTPNALWPSAAGSNGASYFLKVDAAGKIVTNTYLLVTNGSLQVGDFTAASNGDWMIAAQAVGPGPVRAGGVEIPGPPGTLLLLRLDHSGTVLRGGRWLDAGDQPGVEALRADPAGALFVAGYTSADNFPATGGAFGQKRRSGTCFSGHFFFVPFPCTTGFLMKLDGTDLHTIAATYLGGTATAAISGLAVDRQGNPMVTGSIIRDLSRSPDGYPVTPGAFQTTYQGSGSLPFVTRLTPDLSGLTYSTFLGGTKNDSSSAIEVDEEGRALVSGVTTSPDFPATGVFAAPCGPQDPNSPPAGFVTRLSADGSSIDSSAILDSPASIQFLEGGDPVTIATSLVRVHMRQATGPAARCTVNGANYRRESFVGPGQLITVMGGPFPPQAKLLFDGVAAPLLYAGTTQLNAVVPRSAAGRSTTLMEIDVDGARSNARQFDVHPANPSVKIWIAPDGSVDNRGNLLADVALSDGTPNTEEKPAHIGEVVTIFVSGIDAGQPVAMRLNFTDVPVLRIAERPGSFGAVVGLDVQIPGPAGGMYVISIQNGSSSTAVNAGFIWTQ